MSRNPLTPSECTQILDLRKTGSSLAKIAKEMHRGKRTISEFLKSSETLLSGRRSSYRELKSSPRKGNQEFIRVDYRKYGSNDNGSEEPAPVGDGAFGEVSLEHRVIIKFLSKLGKENQGIFEDIKTAFEENYPSIESIDYWTTQFKNGRDLVLLPFVPPKRGRGRPRLKSSSTPVLRKLWVNSRASDTPKGRKPNKMKFGHQDIKKGQGKGRGQKGSIKVKRLGTKKKLLTIKFPTLKKLKDLN